LPRSTMERSRFETDSYLNHYPIMASNSFTYFLD
jgi:hypothetical protein